MYIGQIMSLQKVELHLKCQTKNKIMDAMENNIIYSQLNYLLQFSFTLANNIDHFIIVRRDINAATRRTSKTKIP